MVLIPVTASKAFGSASAGYSEFYIPGDEALMMQVLEDVGGNNQTGTNGYMHSVITVTVWSDNTRVYYDHWENGYGFDPDNPVSTADETYSLTNNGESKIFESDDIPTYNTALYPGAYGRDPSDTDPDPIGTPLNDYYYDGRDRIYVAGGAATVSRADWTEAAGTLLAVAWEIYPVRPQLTTYILPFGEDLALSTADTPPYPDGPNYNDFDRVYALIQSTGDNTLIQVDLNKDGTYDSLDWDRDGTVDGTSTTLNKGEVFLLDRVSIGDQAIDYSGTIPDAIDDGDGTVTDNLLISGTTIQASNTVQVQYIIGDQGTTYEIRGLSAFPRGFWDDEYYAPVDSPESWDDPINSDPTDIYLYNPHDTSITINYETTVGAGAFTIPSKTTLAYSDTAATGGPVPEDSSVYLKGSDVFWGISIIDAEGSTHDWGYSLVPAFLLENEHYIGWAPGSFPVGNYNDSGVYITAAQDNITVYVDFNADGFDDTIAPVLGGDVSFNLSRLQTQYVYDEYDGDMSNANIYGTGPYALVYGQNPDTSSTGSPATDVGYTTIPGNDFIDLVLTVDKSVTPQVLPTTIGEQAEWTVVVNSYDFSIDNISVVDTLPTGWAYVDGTTTITMPNGSTKSDNPDVDTSILTWDDSILGSLAANQEISITFTAVITQSFSAGDFSKNDVKAIGSRTVESVTQTFTTTDFEFVTYGDAVVGIVKTTGGTDLLSPGDTFTYTVEVSNPATASTDITGIAIYDPLPEGVSYEDASASVALSGPFSIFYDFESGAQGFTSSGSSGGTFWERGQPLPHAGITCVGGAGGNCYGTGPTNGDHTNPGGNGNCWGTDLDDRYANDIPAPDDANAIYLYSPVYDFSGSSSVQISYWEWLEIEGNPYDHAYLEYSVNGGPFISAFTFNAYSLDTAWEEYTYDASLVVAGQDRVQWRWSIDSDAGWQFGGWYIDDVLVTADGTASVYANDPPNFVSSGDGYSLSPGESLILTFEVTVDDPLATGIDKIVNQACVTATEIPLSICDDVQNIVLNSSTENGSVGNRIWLDSDGDGVEDIGESGLVGIEVTLKDEYGTPLLTTTTDNNGYYLFTNVAFDSGYYVEITDGLPAGLTQSTDGRTDDRTDSFALSSTSVGTSGNVADDFSRDDDSNDYNDNDGSVNWANEWTETGDGGGSSSAGDIQVDDNQRIEFRAGTDANDSIQRTANIPDGVTFITILYFFDPDNDLDGKDDLVVEYSSDGGATWETALQRVDGDTPDNSNFEHNITWNPANSTITLRFRAEDAIGNKEEARFDNVVITYTGPGPPISEYLDADIGYQPDIDTAIIGDRVWSDADGDGVQDAGESGLGGITLRLYTDTDGDGVIDGGETYVETTAAADGSYQFTGVSATGSQDYIVYIDETQTALSDYDITTTEIYSVINAADGGSYLINDFGFNQKTSGTTHSIKDRVWIDNGDGGGTTNNGNGIQDGTEAGIANVTAVLRDNSNNIIALTTTDVNGDFEFTGVPDDVRYSWEVTDQNGVLTDYYGTTTSAQAGDYQMPGTLTADIDFTSPTLAPNFGYNITRSIGDFVWNDSDGEGDQDAGEPGIAGVVVQLYKDTDGIIGLNTSTDTYIGQTTTNGYGKYLFSGLDDGNYIAHIPGGQAVLSSFTETNDDDVSVAGEQQSASITSGASNLNADFGYEPDNPVDISGRIWDDANYDGDDESGLENGFASFTVRLLDGIDIVAEVQTESNGDYTFKSVPGGTASVSKTYTVQIIDTNGALIGYTTTFENTEGINSAPYNSQEAVDVFTADITDIDFGYYKPPIITRAVISKFVAYKEGGKAVIRWETVSEKNTIGFYLKRLNGESGKYRKVTRQLFPALLEPAGGIYRYVDKDAVPGERYTYRLIEVTAKGKTRRYGPYSVRVGNKKNSYKNEKVMGTREYAMDPHEITISKKARRKAAKAAHEKTKIEKQKRKGSVKIAVRNNGLYFLDIADIADMFGITDKVANRWVTQNRLILSSQGLPVATMLGEDNSGIFFYGEGINSTYTNDNIYWLIYGGKGAGDTMDEVSGDAPYPATGYEAFADTFHFEEDHKILTGPFDDPGADFWFWDFVVAGNPYVGSKPFVLTASGAADAGTANLCIHLHGATDTNHHASIALNGEVIGEGYWNGMMERTVDLDFDQTLLIDGVNIVEVTGLQDTGALQSVFHVDSFDLTWQRYYQAINDRLIVRGDENSVVSVDNFSSPEIRVFELKDPAHPKHVTAITIDEADTGNYRVSFSPDEPDTEYLVLTIGALNEAVSVAADIPSSLKRKRNYSEYLVITPLELKEAAQALADYRQEQGLVTKVVELEDIMDEFNYGVYSPEAVRDFLSYAYNKWRTPPRYVVLAGEGTFDYKENLGDGANLMPPVLVSSVDGLMVSDNHFVDVEGDDGIPEMAIGRIPAVTPEEFYGCINKIRNYESSGAGDSAHRVLMVVDSPEDGGNFSADSDELADILPFEYFAEKIYLSDHSLSDARNFVINGMNKGALLLNYIGHAGINQLTGDGLLTIDDANLMSNSELCPVMTALTCDMGQFAIPGYDSLSEVLVMKDNGGAIAVWSAAGISSNEEAKILGSGFFGAVFQDGEYVLGDAILRALEGYARTDDNERYMLDVYNLLGDPALQLK